MKGGLVVKSAAALAGLVLALALAGLVSLNTGAGFGAPPLGFGFAAGYEDAAFRAQSSGAGRPAMLEASAFAERALRLAPYLTSARLRLVQIDTQLNQRLTDRAAAQFGRSYELVPLDPDLAVWRIRFAFEHWEYIASPTRQAVINETRSISAIPNKRGEVSDVLNTIRNPNGRLAVALWLRNTHAEQAPAPTNVTHSPKKSP